MSVKRAHFIKYRVPLGPSQEMKFLGPGGTGPPGPSRFLQPWHARTEPNLTANGLLLASKAIFRVARLPKPAQLSLSCSSYGRFRPAVR